MQLLIKVIQRHGKKIRDIRPRTTSNYMCTQRLATLPARIPTSSNDTLRPQEPNILQGCPETQRPTSPMGNTTLQVQPQAYSCTRTTYGPIRRALPLPRPLPRRGINKRGTNPITRDTICQCN